MTAKILIVDDNANNLMALEAVLGQLDRPVVCASSGEEALKHVLSSQFAVILLDVKMQGMDGFETAALIRTRDRSREIPIIFLTGYDDAFREAPRAYDVGAFDYITKPYNADILRHKVAAFVRLFEQAEQLLEAQEGARLRDVFVGVLGHDLRNPVGAISMAAVLLNRAQDIPERHRGTIARISRSAQRMDRLIGDVLDFTRGQLAGGIPIAPEEVKLDEICQELVDELHAIHPHHPILIETQGNPAGYWDAGRLSQAVSNLLANAVQHGARDSVRVLVDGTDEATVRLSVSNSGLIPPEVLPRLFEPFRRGSSHATGLGLGLYIVREIIRAHAGQIHARSNGDRTEFVAALPRKAPVSDRTLSSATAENATPVA
jgi:two-component system sensor histidine kinase/response regulator